MPTRASHSRSLQHMLTLAITEYFIFRGINSKWLIGPESGMPGRMSIDNEPLVPASHSHAPQVLAQKCSNTRNLDPFLHRHISLLPVVSKFPPDSVDTEIYHLERALLCLLECHSTAAQTVKRVNNTRPMNAGSVVYGSQNNSSHNRRSGRRGRSTSPPCTPQLRPTALLLCIMRRGPISTLYEYARYQKCLPARKPTKRDPC